MFQCQCHCFYTHRNGYQDQINQIFSGQFLEGLNSLDWQDNPELAYQLQESVLQSAVMGKCRAENVREYYIKKQFTIIIL